MQNLGKLVNSFRHFIREAFTNNMTFLLMDEKYCFDSKWLESAKSFNEAGTLR